MGIIVIRIQLRNADCMSRFPQPFEGSSEWSTAYWSHPFTDVTSREVKERIRRDPILGRVLDFVCDLWPEQVPGTDQWKPFQSQQKPRRRANHVATPDFGGITACASRDMPHESSSSQLRFVAQPNFQRRIFTKTGINLQDVNTRWFTCGEEESMRNYSSKEDKWIPGVIEKKAGSCHTMYEQKLKLIEDTSNQEKKPGHWRHPKSESEIRKPTKQLIRIPCQDKQQIRNLPRNEHCSSPVQLRKKQMQQHRSLQYTRQLQRAHY